MTSSSHTLSGRAPSTQFLELLPATTYVMPKPRPLKDSDRCTHIEDAMPTADDIKAAIARRRSSSASTISSVGTSSDGQRSRYLQLVPEVDGI